MIAQTRISLFPRAQEAIHIWWPIAVAAAVVGAFAFGPSQLAPGVFHSLNLLAALLFLNVVHNAFTLHLIFGTPEMRDWLRERTRGRTASLLFRWSAAYAAIFGLILFWFVYHDTFSAQGLILAKIALSLPFAVHGVRQQMGISLLYNREAERLMPADEQLRLRGCERRERVLFNALLTTFCLAICAGIADLRPAAILFGGLTILVSFGVLLNSRRYPRAKSSNKTLFLVRTIALGISPFSQAATLALPFSHGLEYAFLYRRMRKNSLGGSNTFLFALCAAVIALLLFEPNHGMGWITGPWLKNQPLLFRSLAAASAATSFMHCYLDAVIFRMSDPVTRRALEKLLHPAQPGAEERNEAA